MEIKIQLKHVIIPLIVVIVTTFSWLFEESNFLSSVNINVSYLYSEIDITTESRQKYVWDSLASIRDFYQEDENSKTTIGLSPIRSSGPGDAAAKLNSYATQSNIVVIYGSEYNNTLQDVIESNLSTYFILIDNNTDFVGARVKNVKVDTPILVDLTLEQIKNSKTKKIGYVSKISSEFDNVFYQMYQKILTDMYPDMELYYIVVDSGQNSQLGQTAVISALEEGVDTLVVEEPSLNDIVLSGATKFNNEIATYNKEQLDNQDDKKQVQSPYQTDQVSVIITADNSQDSDNELNYLYNGLYYDTNEDGIIDLKDDNVLTQIIATDYDIIMYDIVDSILNSDFDSSITKIGLSNGLSILEIDKIINQEISDMDVLKIEE